jgi:hypothetical protein
MINLRCAAFKRKRDVIQQVVGSASEILSECSPYSGFTLVLKRRTPESADPETDSKRN